MLGFETKFTLVGKECGVWVVNQLALEANCAGCLCFVFQWVVCGSIEITADSLMLANLLRYCLCSTVFNCINIYVALLVYRLKLKKHQCMLFCEFYLISDKYLIAIFTREISFLRNMHVPSFIYSKFQYKSRWVNWYSGIGKLDPTPAISVKISLRLIN